MLAIGLDDGLPNFRVDLGRAGRRRRRSCSRRRARPIRRSTFPFIRAGGISSIDGVDRWASIGRTDGMARSRGAGARRIRSRHRQRAARCRRRRRAGATAMPRAAQAIGRSEGLALASLDMFASGAFSARPARSVARRCRRARGTVASTDLERGFQVARRQSAGRPRRPRRAAAPARPAGGGRDRRSSARNDTPRPGGLFDHLAALRRRRRDRRAGHPVRSCCMQLGPIWPSRLTLGGIPLGDCWRHPAIDDRGCDQRPRAAAQAVAMAGLFADRAAADGRHRGDRHRRPHRPCRISQRRAVRRHRRAGVARSRRCAARARGRLGAGRGMARADGGAARPARRDACGSGLDAMPTSLPLAKILEGGTWAAGRGIARERRADGVAAGQGHQRRHGFLGIRESSHGRRHDRRSSAGAAQADADPRQGHLDQVVSRAPQGDRHAAVLRGDARPAADRGRDRDAAGADEVAARSPARSWCSRRCCAPA